MDYLQYSIFEIFSSIFFIVCFKPCYKWITFNTMGAIKDIKDTELKEF